MQNATRDTFRAISNWIPERAPAAADRDRTETRIVHDREEIRRLEATIAGMRDEIALLKERCCKQIDLSPYALRSDVEKVK